MCRRSSGPLAALAIILVVSLGPASMGDEVASYLERHGLDHLLAVHWHEKLEAARGVEREELVLRLADLYAALLERTSDPARQTLLEARSRELLREVPPDGADALRLALLRGTYRSAEKIAERHRLRMASDEEVEQAQATLVDVIPQLQRLQTRIESNLEKLKQRQRRAHDRDADALGRSVNELEGLEKQCRFITAWALYYDAWLAGRPEEARVAQRMFSQLIDPENLQLEPRQVSVDLRGLEAIARSILGIGLCKSMTARVSTAVQWIVLLEHPRTFAALREQAPAWKIAAYLDAGDFVSVLDILRAYDEEEDEQVPLAWLRLGAVGALEDERGSRYALELVQRCVTELASRGELEQVLDLARRYGMESLGRSGFALQYVAGALAYHDARQAHGNESPTLDPNVAAQYRDAATRLTAALNESDVDRYPQAAVACRRAVGWSKYFGGDFLGARTAFLDAADHLPSTEAAEALWMAIVALDQAVKTRPDLGPELETLINRFLREYPSHEHTPKLVLKRALDSDDVSPEMIDELLTVPPSSDVYDAARNRAAQLLYTLYRAADGDAKLERGNEYVTVALPLKEADESRLDDSDLIKNRFVVRCRRLLEVALSPKVKRLVAARSALESLESFVEERPEAMQKAELEYRRLQLMIYRGELQHARDEADALWKEGGLEDSWARLASRALFQDGFQRWRRTSPADPEHRAAVGDVMKYGSRVLQEFQDDPAAWERSNTISYATAVADAAWAVWERSRDVEAGQLALRLFSERLLTQQPKNARFLSSTAQLAQAFGDDELALTCWRRLVTGRSSDDLAWFEAKYHLIRLLAGREPERAREVMEQHVQLNPEYGPPPWGDRLRTLAAELGIEGVATAPSDEDGSTGDES